MPTEMSSKPSAFPLNWKRAIRTALPIAPEFAEFLLSTPELEPTGPVFNPQGQGRERLSEWTVSRRVSAIGKAAGVKVNTDAAGNVKYASAHDLRRSFGERWASSVMSQILMELIRHESIDTTMKFYVGRNAQSTAAVLWKAAGNGSGNTPSHCDTSNAPADEPQSVDVQTTS